MILLNPYLAQQLMEERVKDALRKAEQAKLIRVAKGPRRARGWWASVALMLGSLVGFIVGPQS